MKRIVGLLVVSVSLVITALTFAQAPAPLTPAPNGFDKRREGVERGQVETHEYESKSLKATRRLVVYTPPGYSKDAKYPVFYLLHGAGGNEANWTQRGGAGTILDNLYADKKVVPMIVVMPNGQVTQGGAPGPDRGKAGGAGGKAGGKAAGRGNLGNAIPLFENELLKDVMPFVEAKYPVLTDREHRAVAGLSMGGGQALTIGLRHLDQFAWVGGFSSALIGRGGGANIIPADADKRLKLLWVSCGDADTLFDSNKAFHATLEEKKVPHIWHVDVGGAHTFAVWKNDLYLVAPLLFRDK